LKTKGGNQLIEISKFSLSLCKDAELFLEYNLPNGKTSQSPQSTPDHDTPDQTPVRILTLCS
jgi:hypothetical protein